MPLIHLQSGVSQESVAKECRFRLAAANLGYECINEPPELTLPMTDSAVPLTRLDGLQYLHIAGFRTLEHCPIKLARDLLDIYFDGPIFIKPNKSSGSVSPHPFAYKRFDSKIAAFNEFWTKYENGPIQSPDEFNAFGSLVVSPYLEPKYGLIPGVISIRNKKTKRVAFLPPFIGKMTNPLFCERIEVIPDMDISHVEHQFQYLKFGQLDLPFIYIQFLRRFHSESMEEVWYANDLNFRMSTLLDELFGEIDPLKPYQAMLEYMLGLKDTFDYKFPFKSAIIGKHSATFRSPTHIKGVTWVRTHDKASWRPKWDSAYTFPTFYITGDSSAEVSAKYDEVTANLKPIFE